MGVLAYMFGPFHSLGAAKAASKHLSKDQAVDIMRISALALHEGSWPILGRAAPWCRTDWPLVDFVRFDELLKKHVVVRYSEDDPYKTIAEWPTAVPEGLPRACSYGATAAQAYLTHLLKDKSLH
jgi:hypothetical protein